MKIITTIHTKLVKHPVSENVGWSLLLLEKTAFEEENFENFIAHLPKAVIESYPSCNC